MERRNQSRKRVLLDMDEELDITEALNFCAVANKRARNERSRDEQRDSSWWRNGYLKRFRAKFVVVFFILDDFIV